MRDKRIAVLALQETHIDEARVATLTRIFGNSMEILFSADPVNSTGAKGVAIVINKRILKDCKPTVKQIVPGRAILVTIPWSEDRTLKILNVYAPNDAAENAAFWNELAGSRLGRIDLMLGDCNVVEDAADRIPQREDPDPPRAALAELRDELHLIDGWRLENPMDKGFTFLQESTLSQSRLDRIYARQAMLRDCSDWKLEDPGIPTDHRLVSVAVENYKAPFIGKGRWVMPAHLLTDAEMKKTMKLLGQNLLARLRTRAARTDAENPQTAYADFKRELVSAARTRAKEKVPKIQKRMDRIRTDLHAVLNPEPDSRESCYSDQKRTEQAAVLQETLTKLEQKRFGWRRHEVEARHWAHSETMTKYWTRGNTTPEVTEVMYSMLQPEGPNRSYTNHSRTMARIARDFYDGIQDDDPLEEGEDHDAYIDEALLATDVRLSAEDADDLGHYLDRDDVADTIKGAATGKAPGLDGLPTEVWKAYQRWYDADVKRGAPAVDMTQALMRVYNDIEEFGIIAGSTFAHGWICPVYKLKKDKREINNYRPITLLNSDYKLMTKALASKLATVAPAIIHEDQAGFIPGRRIFDHIRLSQLMIEYAEMEELNGAIVALDQEKAYDKIDHAYLWRVLRHMNFPEPFIRTLQHLYAGAESCVIINGVKSELFKIRRGVRQGDPISCLIFNFAIEPLVCALRKSSLRGLSVPGEEMRLIAKLFADDTTVYLSADDDYEVMYSIADRWCRAARARFNAEKTEVLPIGSRVYREELVATRRMRPNGRPIPATAHIVDEGEAIRSLGAWIGNGINLAAPWMPVLDTIATNLAKWDKSRPTLNGRKLAVGIEVGGRTQFRATVQAMPASVEQRITSTMMKFMWGAAGRPRIAREQLYLPIAKGGLKLLDIGTRNEAIHLMWLKTYLTIGLKRPPWTKLADALLANAVAAESRSTEREARLNTFLQTWRVSTRAKAGLPTCLKEMIKAARKYGVRCVTANPTKNLREQLPVWSHVGRLPGCALENTPSCKCLRRNHQVRTVGQCLAMARRLRDDGSGHAARPSCECADCVSDRDVAGCDNPHRCATAAERVLAKLGEKWSVERDGNVDGLTLTSRRKRENVSARLAHERIVFNPSVSVDTPVAGALSTLR